VALLIWPIAHITSNYNEFKQGGASVDRIFELVANSAHGGGKAGCDRSSRDLTGKVNIAAWLQTLVKRCAAGKACPAGEELPSSGLLVLGKTTLVSLLPASP